MLRRLSTSTVCRNPGDSHGNFWLDAAFHLQLLSICLLYLSRQSASIPALSVIHMKTVSLRESSTFHYSDMALDAGWMKSSCDLVTTFMSNSIGPSKWKTKYSCAVRHTRCEVGG